MSNDPITYDAGDANQIAEKTKAANARRDRLIDALRWLLADRRGRRYLADLVRESGALQRVVGADPQTVMFLDGQRSLGFKVLNDVRSLDHSKPFAALVNSVLTGDEHGSDE
jgi:hypothetical protein